MTGYKEMYLQLFRVSEDAVNIIIKAQRECEKMYMSDEETQALPTDVDQKPEKS